MSDEKGAARMNDCDNCGTSTLLRGELREIDPREGVYVRTSDTDGPFMCEECCEAVDHALAARRGKPTESRADLEVLDAIDLQRVLVNLRPLTPAARTTAKIKARRKAGATTEQMVEVVQAFGALAMRDPSKRTLLNAITPFTGPSSRRTGGWHWGLALVEQQEQSRQVRGVVPKTVDEIERERAG